MMRRRAFWVVFSLAIWAAVGCEEKSKKQLEPWGQPPGGAEGASSGGSASETLRAKKLGREASAALNAGDARNARDLYLEALSIEKGNAEFHKGIAEAYGVLKGRERAVHHYNEYLRLRPSASDASNIRKKIVKLGGTPESAGERKSENRPLKAISKDESPLAKGDRLFAKRKWKAAKDAYLEGTQKEPKNPSLHLGLGKAYEKLNNPKGAIHHYRKHLKYKPTSKEAERILKYIFANKG
jgi:Tfp pilus assembly protein PilF